MHFNMIVHARQISFTFPPQKTEPTVTSVNACLPSKFYITVDPTSMCRASKTPAYYRSKERQRLRKRKSRKRLQRQPAVAVPGEAKNRNAKKSTDRLMRIWEKTLQHAF